MYNEIGFKSYKDADKVRQSLPNSRKLLDYDDHVFWRLLLDQESFLFLGGTYEK